MKPNATSRERAQAWLRFKGNQPSELRISSMERLAVRITSPRPDALAALGEVVLHPRKRHDKRRAAKRLDQAGMLGIKGGKIIRKP